MEVNTLLCSLSVPSSTTFQPSNKLETLITANEMPTQGKRILA